MTPALRAQLAKKYNMRPEDYKPCAWSDDYTTQSYGDYPLLEYENAANKMLTITGITTICEGTTE